MPMFVRQLAQASSKIVTVSATLERNAKIAMKIAAATVIAELTPDDELLPSIFEPGLHDKVVEAAKAAYLAKGS